MLKRALVILMLLALCAPVAWARPRLRLATTTSTENSGLLQVLLPPFEQKLGVKVDVISVGTGKALELGRRCDVDVVMVHAPALEREFVARGFGLKRHRLMHNYFIIVGPASDPARVKEAPDAVRAFRRIAAAKAGFVSRGDNSGTHVKERSLWKAAGIEPSWPGYKEAGQGMGAVLTMAGQLGAYTLSDSGTFLKYQSVGRLPLMVLYAKDARLENPYSVIAVNPERCPRVKAGLAQAFIAYLVSPLGQRTIREYRARGKQLFWPDAIE